LEEAEMFELKPLSRDAITSALAKAERYRLLNEAEEAESICHDVLAVEPHHQQALMTLILSITDQFRDHGVSGNLARAQDLVPQLTDEYNRHYYAGIICERRAKAYLSQNGLQAGAAVYDWFREAMRLFELAEAIRPAGNDDAVLRWNACVRALKRHPHLQPAPEEERQPIMSE
jgi:hypothetical protein